MAAHFKRVSWLRAAGMLLALSGAAAAPLPSPAVASHHCLWRVVGRHNSVYLRIIHCLCRFKPRSAIAGLSSLKPGSTGLSP